MVGAATFTMKTSSTAMNWAVRTTARSSRGRLSGPGDSLFSGIEVGAGPGPVRDVVVMRPSVAGGPVRVPRPRRCWYWQHLARGGCAHDEGHDDGGRDDGDGRTPPRAGAGRVPAHQAGAVDTGGRRYAPGAAAAHSGAAPGRARPALRCGGDLVQVAGAGAADQRLAAGAGRGGTHAAAGRAGGTVPVGRRGGAGHHRRPGSAIR